MLRNRKISGINRRLSMLVLLVVFVFIVLFVSIAISGAIVYFLMRANILQPLSEHRFIPILLLVLIVSLLIGTAMSIFGGERILRPMRKMMAATKEIAAGNFNVRVDASGAREIDRLAESFNEMAKELSSIETLRTDFIGNISHEFKTPIVSIRGFARRIRKAKLTCRLLPYKATARVGSLSSVALLAPCLYFCHLFKSLCRGVQLSC